MHNTEQITRHWRRRVAILTNNNRHRRHQQITRHFFYIIITVCYYDLNEINAACKEFRQKQSSSHIEEGYIDIIG